MFSEVFKARKPGEIEDYFVVGTSKTTPPLDEVETGWPKPWFFMRVLIFFLAVYLLLSKTIDAFGNPHEIPGLIILGSLAVPLATVFLFWELNTPRNVSFVQVLMLVCLGGVISLVFTEIVDRISNLGWLGNPSAGIEEEVAKLLAVVLVVRSTRYKYILNGLVFGAAIGCGFAAFETAGYAYFNGFLTGFMYWVMQHLDVLQKQVNPDDIGAIRGAASDISRQAYSLMFGSIETRSYLAPFGHIAWTAISGAALWRVKGAQPFHFKMLIEPTFLRVFFIPVALHMAWDTNLIQGQQPVVRNALLFGLGVIAWYVAFLLVQQGLKQIKQAQLEQARTDYTRTREVLTTTGRWRAQVSSIR
jgi:RsiW-degrading membrane proteinase PrsW (M82 family)